MLRRACTLLRGNVSLHEMKAIAMGRTYALAADPKDITAHDRVALSTVLVDVRTDQEVAMTGLIPTAIHIPMSDIQDAFEHGDDEYFIAKGLTEAIDPSRHRVVIYCAAGIRSAAAMEYVESLGFDQVAHYPGGWNEYGRQPITDDHIAAFLKQQDSLRGVLRADNVE